MHWFWYGIRSLIAAGPVSLIVVQDFPVRATDDIGRVYGVADEDLDDMIMDALAACGKQLPPQAMLDKLVPVLRVRDFALFVAACPPAENANPC